jgi:hypothetical protein
LADHPISAPGSRVRVFDKENIYAHEKSLEAIEPYARRTTDIVVVETGLKTSVPTKVLMVQPFMVSEVASLIDF